MPDYPCPAYEEAGDSSSDDDTDVLQGFMYNDSGELVPVPKDGPPNSVSTTVPTTEPPPPSEFPRPPMNLTARLEAGKRDVTVPRDANGKFGVKITRMGSRFFLSFVEQSSSAAKCGLGFGDQILAVHGIDTSRMTGSRLMCALARSPAKEICFTVVQR
ncbi:unnamed protein product [Echinostoma caproni]|uniref:PDZ domain-containing protein n=1 Tax=Echinostoma caproni TaxID=27848 RepID=A0A183A603_9TREM|nr:unnamed protein product [Echinostoma caproni]